jgi:hypothetical protein
MFGVYIERSASGDRMFGDGAETHFRT